MALVNLEKDLEEYAASILQKRLDRLAGRRFVLFPWLRAKWLMRKFAFIKRTLKK